MTGVEHSRNSLLDPKKSKNYIYWAVCDFFFLAFWFLAFWFFDFQNKFCLRFFFFWLFFSAFLFSNDGNAKSSSTAKGKNIAFFLFVFLVSGY